MIKTGEELKDEGEKLIKALNNAQKSGRKTEKLTMYTGWAAIFILTTFAGMVSKDTPPSTEEDGSTKSRIEKVEELSEKNRLKPINEQ